MAAALDNPHIYELRIYELRNDLHPARIQEFFKSAFLPACQRAGVGPVGCFTVVAGLQAPALVVLLDHASMAAMQACLGAMKADAVYAQACQAFECAAEMPYVRCDSTLLEAFEAHPKTEIPPFDATRPPRLFELRTYRSRSGTALASKLEMMNKEEIRIFRACGFAPVFFGAAIAGGRLPHLTYLSGFDNMAARDKAWDSFRVNADWLRIKATPGWTDPEVVCNVHSSFLLPTDYSQIR